MIFAATVWSAIASAIVCATTGVLLSVYYVPSADVARDADGHSQVIRHATNAPLVDAWGDTVALQGQYAALSGVGRSASVARVSVEVSIANAWGGGILRAAHRASALACLLSMMAAIVVVAIGHTQAPSWLWPVSAVLLVAIVVAMWTGMVLPDDAYAEASLGVVRAAIADGIVGGAVLEGLTGRGITSVQPLARTYAMHAWLLPIVLAGGLGLLVRRCGLSFTKQSLVVGLVIIGASIPVALLRPDGTKAWYPFRAASMLQEAFGSELASYIVLAWLLAVATIPWWQPRSGRWTMPVVVVGGILVIVLSALLS